MAHRVHLSRGLVVGGFVFPVAIGLGVALAGVFGRLGRRFVVPSLVALLGLAVVVIVVSTSTVGGSIEERYVMYVYTPIAVLAVAGLPMIHRIWYWLIPGGAAALYALAGRDSRPRRERRTLLRRSRRGVLDARRPASPGRLGGRSARLAVHRRQGLAARRGRSGRDVDLRGGGRPARSRPRDRPNPGRRSRSSAGSPRRWR